MNSFPWPRTGSAAVPGVRYLGQKRVISSEEVQPSVQVDAVLPADTVAPRSTSYSLVTNKGKNPFVPELLESPVRKMNGGRAHGHPVERRHGVSDGRHDCTLNRGTPDAEEREVASPIV
jgi:hypothetical protein